MGKTRPSAELQKQIREAEIELSRKFAWDSMAGNQLVIRKVGDPGPAGANPSGLGNISNSTPRVTLDKGEYELPDTILTRNFIDHLIQKDLQPMPDVSQYGMRGSDDEYGSMKWYQKVGYRLNPANLKDLAQVTKQPLKFSVKKDPDSGLANINMVDVPKNTAEYAHMTGALLRVAKSQYMRQVLFRFPKLEPSQQNPAGNPKRVKLDRVLMALQMTQKLNAEAKRINPDAPPMCLRLSDTIHKRLAMQPSNEKERLLMAEIIRLEKELSNEVKNDIKSGKREAKAAQTFLSGELKKNLTAAKKAHDALVAVAGSPAATPAQLQASLKALHAELNKVDDNIKAIQQQLDSNVLDKSIAEAYKKSVDEAKTEMATITAQAQATLLNHADPGVVTDATAANNQATQIRTQNDALINELQLLLAPHFDKADLLLATHAQKLQAYQAAANNVLAALEAGGNPTPQELSAYQTSLTELDQATDVIKQEIRDIESEQNVDIITLRDKYETPINSAAWDVTTAISDRFAALPNPDPLLSQPADNINNKMLGINGDITNDLLNAPQARP